VIGVVEIGQEMGCPGDGVGFTGTGGVLDQVFMSGSFGKHRCQQLAGGVQLLIAGEDHTGDLLLFVTSGNQIAADDLQPALPLPDLLPQVGGTMATLVSRVARRTVIPLVEGKENCGRPLQPGGHPDFRIADRKMDQRPTGEVKQ